MDRQRASQVVRVRIVKGQESILDKFKELKVRAEIVRQVAYLYIEHHMEDLMKLKGAQEIHAKMQQRTVRESLKRHVGERIRTHFPAEEFPVPEGGIMPEFYQMVSETDAVTNSFSRRPRLESAFENKQSTMPDAEASDINDVFRSVRPNSVLDEASVDNTLPPNLQTEYALSQVAGTTVVMSNKFGCLLYTSPSPRDATLSRMPSSA